MRNIYYLHLKRFNWHQLAGVLGNKCMLFTKHGPPAVLPAVKSQTCANQNVAPGCDMQPEKTTNKSASFRNTHIYPAKSRNQCQQHKEEAISNIALATFAYPQALGPLLGCSFEAWENIKVLQADRALNTHKLALWQKKRKKKKADNRNFVEVCSFPSSPLPTSPCFHAVSPVTSPDLIVGGVVWTTCS